MLIDTHSHLQFKQYNGQLDQVITRAHENGVDKMIVVGCDIKSSRDAVFMAGKNEEIYAAVGLHPQDAKNKDKDFEDLFEKLLQKDKVVAVGETGLDYFKLYSPKEKQIDLFKLHIKYAKKYNLPLIIHNRDADEKCIEVLLDSDYRNAVFHCFGSGLAFAKTLWKEGIMTSFTGIVTYPSAEDLREVVRECPMELMMIESDCPFLAPQKFRGGTNEPSYINEIAELIAKEKNISYEEVCEVTTKNAMEFFKLS